MGFFLSFFLPPCLSSFRSSFLPFILSFFRSSFLPSFLSRHGVVVEREAIDERSTNHDIHHETGHPLTTQRCPTDMTVGGWIIIITVGRGAILTHSLTLDCGDDWSGVRSSVAGAP